MDLRNIGIILQIYMVSRSEIGGRMALRDIDIILQLYTVSQPEDGGLNTARNITCFSFTITIF